MSVGKSRGPKSSNRIELSWFVQVLLHFYWFESPRLWGRGQVDWEVYGGMDIPSHTYMHVHTHMHMYRNCKLPQYVYHDVVPMVPMSSPHHSHHPYVIQICGDSSTYGWVYALVGGWVNGCGHVKSLKIE